MSLKEAFQQALAGAFGEFLGDALGWVVLLVVLIVGSIPVYFLMRRFGWGPRPGAIRFTTSWDQAAEAQQLSNQLDQVESGLITFYRYFLYFLILLVTGFAVFLLRKFSGDADKSVELYLGVGYLMFLAWVGTELWKLHWRRYIMSWNRPTGAPSGPGRAIAAIVIGSILAISAVSTLILWTRMPH